MPTTVSFPKYRRHKARDLAVVTIRGKDHYLGRLNSPESKEKYHRLLAECLSSLKVTNPVRDEFIRMGQARVSG